MFSIKFSYVVLVFVIAVLGKDLITMPSFHHLSLSSLYLRLPNLRHKPTLSSTTSSTSTSTRSRWQRHKRLRVCSIRSPHTRQIRRHHLGAISNVPVIQSAVEHGESSLRLVVRYLVTGLVDAEEAEVAVLAHFAVLGAVDCEGLVARGGEFGAVGVVESQRDCLAAEPVADVVGVAGCLC